MRNIMIFIVFCCAVGCGAVFSFYYYGDDWLAVPELSATDDADDVAVVQQPEKNCMANRLLTVKPIITIVMARR